jgi:hypothetical protein
LRAIASAAINTIDTIRNNAQIVSQMSSTKVDPATTYSAAWGAAPSASGSPGVVMTIGR